MQRNVYLKLVTLEEARTTLFARCSESPLRHEAVSLAQAQGRTLAEPAAAKLSSPSFHGAAMDGVALAAEDTFGASERRPVTLIIGRNAHWVNTGFPLPESCNAVVMVEELIPGKGPNGEETVILEKAAFPWQHVRKLGEDMVATEILLPPGTVIGAYELGALAASGVLEPVVFARPKVAIIPSGSELVSLQDADTSLLSSGRKLPEFNSLVLSALVRDAGGEASIYPIVPDDPQSITEALQAAANSDADLVVINAGSSAGSKDYTAGCIEAVGELWLHGISMMPGKPTAIGRIAGKPVLGIPGYPVSAILAFEEFGQALLARWQGRSVVERPVDEAVPFQPLPSRPGTEEFIRVKLGQVDNSLVAVALPRGSGTVSSLSRADGIIRIPAPSEGIPAGQNTPVRLLRSREHVAGTLLAIGSHDNALDLLDSLLRKHKPGYSLTSAHVGSLGGLMALKSGKCHLAGSHLLGSDGIYNRAAIEETLPGTAVHVVRLADREQGLIVPPGNPLGIKTLRDLAREDVCFINRQRGSGTRVLLDWELGRLGICSDEVRGYENEEYTHMNIAAAVLSGRASAGLGVRAAAVALGLAFVPVGVEEYDLVVRSRYWEDARVVSLLEVVRSDIFKTSLLNLGGYGVERTGELLWTFEG